MVLMVLTAMQRTVPHSRRSRGDITGNAAHDVPINRSSVSVSGRPTRVPKAITISRLIRQHSLVVVLVAINQSNPKTAIDII